MPTAEGAQLSIVICQKMEEMKALCKGIDEDAASRAPAGRWSPKEILSHLCGPEGVGISTTIQTILEKDTRGSTSRPRIRSSLRTGAA